jgi:putative glutamine amidotransferase
MANRTRPWVGLNADLTQATKHASATLRLAPGYCDAIAAAGGLPIIVPPFLRDPSLSEYLDRLDGFVLTGSPGDLDPRKHGLPMHHTIQLIHSRKDDSDRSLVNEIISRRLPILAIGLGMQQLNLALGGTLYSHIPEELPKAMPHRDPTGGPHRHLCKIVKGTHMEAIYGPEDILVNSHHHQAIAKPGKGLRVGAMAPDGVIEAIENVGPEWFCIGVQWHPESDTATALDVQLFQAFLAACQHGKGGLRLAA